MSYIGMMIKNLREAKNITQKELADELHVSTVTISSWENGNKNPSIDAVRKIAIAFHVSSDIMLNISDEDAPMFSDREIGLVNRFRSLDTHGKTTVETVCDLEYDRVKKNKRTISLSKTTKSNRRFIPRYLTSAAAGPSFPVDGDEYDLIQVDDSIPEAADFAVVIHGTSMLPYIHDGETVYVRRSPTIEPGEIGIFNVDGSLYCKRYVVDKEGNVSLVSTNSAMQKSNVVIMKNGTRAVRLYGVVIS